MNQLEFNKGVMKTNVTNVRSAPGPSFKLPARKRIEALMTGVLSAFDMTGAGYLVGCAERRALTSDEASLRRDWQDVGNDIQSAMNQFQT